MHEATETHLDPNPLPRQTVMKRYKRLQLRGIAAVAWLVCVALLALMLFVQTFPRPKHVRGPYTREGREYRLFDAFLQAIVEPLRGCGLSNAAIRIAMASIFAISLIAIVGVIIYVKRAAPPKAQRLRKKELIAQ